MTAAGTPRVAVLGARGIGRHHARWWHLSGAHVCAHLGTSEASVGEAAEKMRGLFDYQGRGYTDLAELLAAEQPDWIDVASRNEAHYDQVKTALEAGCQVLAEKPLVYDPGLSAVDLMAQTNELLAFADHQNLVLGMCAQYCVAAEICLRLFREQKGAEPIRQLKVDIASPTRGRPADPLGTWIDLGPHVLSIVQTVAAGLDIAFPVNPVPLNDRRFEGYEAACAFELPGLAVSLQTWRTTAAPANVRQLTINEMTFDLEGENDEQGIYRARFDYPGGSYRCDDTMHQLIQACLKGDPPMHGAAIRANQNWLLGIGAG